ncbi:MAG: hypothetical protein ACE5IQ_01350 [Candidatus Methylomirabilales bacterium]
MSVLEVQSPKSYIVWVECGRIYLTVDEGGKPTIKADWSMADIDAALNALREEVLAHTQALPRVSPVDGDRDAGQRPPPNVQSGSRV